MRAIVDTNVWVSAFLTPGGAPGGLLREVEWRRLTLAFDRAIEAEYREVLSRPRFNISPVLVDAFLTRLREEGLYIGPARVAEVRLPTALPDPEDQPFMAVALAADCPVVTGNLRHFPPDCGVQVLSPAACLERVHAR